MDRVGAGGLGAWPDAELIGDIAELADEFSPLAQAGGCEEMIVAPGHELAAGERVAGVVLLVPDLEQCQKIAGVIAKDGRAAGPRTRDGGRARPPRASRHAAVPGGRTRQRSAGAVRARGTRGPCRAQDPRERDLPHRRAHPPRPAGRVVRRGRQRGARLLPARPARFRARRDRGPSSQRRARAAAGGGAAHSVARAHGTPDAGLQLGEALGDAEAALEQRFVVRQPERRLRIGQRLGPVASRARRRAGSGTRRTAASSGRGTSLFSKGLDHVGHEIALALKETGERDVQGHCGPGDQRIGVRKRRNVVGGAHERPRRVERRQGDGQAAHERSLPCRPPGTAARRAGRGGRARPPSRGRSRRIGPMALHPPVGQLPEIAPAGGQLLRQNPGKRQAAIGSRTPGAGHAPRRARRGAPAARNARAGAAWTERSSRISRVADGTRLTLYSEVRCMLTQSRDRTKEQARGQRYAHDHGQPHRPQLRGARSRTTPSGPRISGRSRSTDDDFGLMTYDPAFMNTAACRSAITFIDGDKGILRYRGYPIEQLAERATFLEVAYLLCEGELPDRGAARASGTRRSSTTPTSTPTSPSSSRGSATTPTRWGCCSAWWARSRPSIPTPSTSTIRPTATSSGSGCSPRRRPSRRSPSAIRAACRSSSRTTTWTTSATSST